MPDTIPKSALAPSRFHVVIPCYNCERYIDICLDSLRNQTFTQWTALIADDASQDRTARLASRHAADDPRITVHSGFQRAWLMGNTLAALRSLHLAPSDVVAVLDGDDFIRPDCLQRLWDAHQQGYDIVYTDETIERQKHSIGGPLLRGVPVREQAWCFSQLRSFKAYLFGLLDDATFRDESGRYFRAAGDLSLYLPMTELAGPDKVHFIPERLYFYRVHDQCNSAVMRHEQLCNNRYIRSRPALARQTTHFDFRLRLNGHQQPPASQHTPDLWSQLSELIQNEVLHQHSTIDLPVTLEKSDLPRLGPAVRALLPQPYTIAVEHIILPEERDAWRAYHGLWIGEGVFLMGVPASTM